MVVLALIAGLMWFGIMFGQTLTVGYMDPAAAVSLLIPWLLFGAFVGRRPRPSTSA
jgi:hypothetical protein